MGLFCRMGLFLPKKPSNWELCVCLVFSKVTTHCPEVTSHRSRLAHGPLFATEPSNWDSCACLVFLKVQTQSFKVTCYCSRLAHWALSAKKPSNWESCVSNGLKGENALLRGHVFYCCRLVHGPLSNKKSPQIENHTFILFSQRRKRTPSRSRFLLLQARIWDFFHKRALKLRIIFMSCFFKTKKRKRILSR